MLGQREGASPFVTFSAGATRAELAPAANVAWLGAANGTLSRATPRDVAACTSLEQTEFFGDSVWNSSVLHDDRALYDDARPMNHFHRREQLRARISMIRVGAGC